MKVEYIDSKKRLLAELAEGEYTAVYIVLHTKDGGIQIAYDGTPFEMVASGQVMSAHGLAAMGAYDADEE